MKTRACDNPFSNERVDDLLFFEPEWLGVTWADLMGRLEELDYRGAVVGPHGSGKTTLLSALRTKLEAEGFSVQRFFLNEESRDLNEEDWRRLDTAGRAVILLDGAEQFSWMKWRKFLRMASPCRGLVITQHKVGKLPLWLTTQTSVEMLQEFVQRLDPGFVNRGVSLADLYQKSQGNVREALWLCYDIVAE